MYGKRDCHDWLRMELTDNQRNRPKINVYYFRYANRTLNAHLNITRQRVARRSWLFAENMPPGVKEFDALMLLNENLLWPSQMENVNRNNVKKLKSR